MGNLQQRSVQECPLVHMLAHEEVALKYTVGEPIDVLYTVVVAYILLTPYVPPKAESRAMTHSDV